MKTIFKTIVFLLALLLPATVSAHDFEVNGIYYNVINDNEVEVTYKGPNFYSFSNEYSGNVIIPIDITYNAKNYTVSTIGNNAFYYCTGMTSIVIPNSIDSISNGAFQGCSSLTSIDIPISVKSIGNAAFYGCSNLLNIEIPNSVKSIGDMLFIYCTSLTNVTLGNSVKSIGNSAFNRCTSLTSIDIPNSVISIGNYAFNGCSSLSSIIIPNSVTTIGDEAFSNCSSLTSINIPNSVTTIGDMAFSGCSGLTNIHIPNSVTSIGNYAFNNCSGLTSIVVASGNTKYDSRNNCNAIIETASNTLMTGCQNTNIPNSITTIGNLAFNGCNGLTSIEIPNSVILIGYRAFDGCSNLTNIGIPNTVTRIKANAFNGTAWYENQPDGVVYAGSVAYKYKGTMPSETSITLKEGTSGITSDAFAGCTGLISIDIPNSVFNIGSGAFDWTKWYDNQPDGVIYAGLVAYSYKGYMPSGTSIILKEGTLGIGDYAFGSMEMKSGSNINRDYRWDLVHIEIPNSVIHIGEGAFNMSRLTRIEIPNSVTHIDDYAFNYCTSLTSIEIGNSVIDIGDNAFYGCSGRIYCYGTTPPRCYNDHTFSDYSATLHVPATSLASYFTTPVWCNFENIVGDAVAPSGISISKDSVEIQLGEQLNLTATVTPANASNKEIYWYSSDTNVATMDNGTVIANGIGECDIIAFCFGMRLVCHVSVFNRISIEEQEAMVQPNHILTLTPTAPVMPEGFIATSSDPSVAAVRVINERVQVVGIKEGTTTITVGSTDGTAVPATCVVTVYTEPGDVNMDGFVNISDVTDIIDYLLSGNVNNFKEANADLDGDGRVSIGDVTDLIDQLLGS